MANFKNVNRKLNLEFPEIGIILHRGLGYAYFECELRDEVPASIMTHPVNTSTDELYQMASQDIAEWLAN